MNPAQPHPATRTGVVHGKTVELDEPTGLPDGERVTVVIEPASAPKKRAPGEGLLRAFGGWSDDPEGLDRFLEEMRRLRDLDISHREIEP